MDRRNFIGGLVAVAASLYIPERIISFPSARYLRAKTLATAMNDRGLILQDQIEDQIFATMKWTDEAFGHAVGIVSNFSSDFDDAIHTAVRLYGDVLKDGDELVYKGKVLSKPFDLSAPHVLASERVTITDFDAFKKQSNYRFGLLNEPSGGALVCRHDTAKIFTRNKEGGINPIDLDPKVAELSIRRART